MSRCSTRSGFSRNAYSSPSTTAATDSMGRLISSHSTVDSRPALTVEILAQPSARIDAESRLHRREDKRNVSDLESWRPRGWDCPASARRRVSPCPRFGFRECRVPDRDADRPRRYGRRRNQATASGQERQTADYRAGSERLAIIGCADVMASRAKCLWARSQGRPASGRAGVLEPADAPQPIRGRQPALVPFAARRSRTRRRTKRAP